MTEPTDWEITQLWNEQQGRYPDPIPFARAILAKWGTPAPVGVEPAVAGEPEGWITWWPTAAGVREPIYSHGPKKPSHGAELDARLRKYAVFTSPQPTQAQAGAVPPIQWPKARDVGRIGDMSQSAHMRVGFDSDNDVFVSVWDERGGGSIEFCNPGGGGGGQSSRTRMALIALMVAMEDDNAEKPSRDWWALRMGGIKGGQHGTE